VTPWRYSATVTSRSCAISPAYLPAGLVTSVVQVSKSGQLLDSMTLALGSSPQGTEFYDTEGITYVGGGKFVVVEERYRQANLFTYVAGGTLQRNAVQSVKLGTTIGNVGLEGLSWDPLTGGFIFVKEKTPVSILKLARRGRVQSGIRADRQH
jgi:uncharacterized protein YjiK